MAEESRTWGRLNLGLVVLILGINFYIFSAPFIPQLQLWLRQRHAKVYAGLPYKTLLDTNSGASATRADIPKDDRLVIPRLALNEHIYEGTSPYLINKGVWANPKDSIPPKGGNTVL